MSSVETPQTPFRNESAHFYPLLSGEDRASRGASFSVSTFDLQIGRNPMKRIVTFVLSLIMVLSLCACGSGNNKSLSEQYSADGLVQLAYSDIDIVCDTAELAAEGGQILSAMQESDTLLMSLVIDSSIEITKDVLKEYDHLVITNPTWINKFDRMDNLISVGHDEISIELQQLISAHMQAWSIDGSEFPDGVSLYKYTGDGLLAFPANVGYGASAIQASDPLIILVDTPADTMKPSSFLLPMTSSGNIIFTNETLLQTEIAASLIAPYVGKIESVKFK